MIGEHQDGPTRIFTMNYVEGSGVWVDSVTKGCSYATLEAARIARDTFTYGPSYITEHQLDIQTGRYEQVGERR